jgi:hypothetical protein
MIFYTGALILDLWKLDLGPLVCNGWNEGYNDIEKRYIVLENQECRRILGVFIW